MIGYGNDLRSDDGAGRVVADLIEAMDLPDVRVLSVMQLTPELAMDMAGVDRVVFVDASVDVMETTIAEVVAEPRQPSAMTHHSSPGALLDLSGTMGRAPSQAFTISIPVTELGLGTELTPMTEMGVERAVEMVIDLIGSKPD